MSCTALSLSLQGLPDLEVQYLGKGKGVMLAASQLSDRVGLKIGSHMRCVHRLLQQQSTHAHHSHVCKPSLMAVLCAFRDSKQATQASTWSKYAVTAELTGH